MKTYTVLSALLLGITAGSATYAQDSRERHYYYEILDPRHEPKPQVNGFATERIAEKLNRGLTAVKGNDGKSVYLSWRLLEQDAPETAFEVYRTANGKTKKLSKRAIRQTCDFTDASPVSGKATYWVVATQNKQKEASEKVDIDFRTLTNYQSISLNRQVKAGKAGIADLNGDGIYDYIIRTPESNVDPGMPGDLTGKTYQIEAYLSDGTFLWSKDLGQGIEPGVWYSPYIVYDFNGDGKAEVALKTAPDNVVRDAKGRVDTGEEHLSILDGMTGHEIARADWPQRNHRYGNLVRRNRNQIGMAFLDGKTPYILACRGTYKLMTVEAWQLKGHTLEHAWTWDGDEENPVIRSMGSHNMVCGDVDGDGRDEILLGSCMLDDNGTLLWSAGLGHPDKIYLSNIDPKRRGMEVFLCLEPWHDNGRGVCMVDARTGQQVWNIGHKTFHVGDGMVADIDPTRPGLECFAQENQKGGSTEGYLLAADGTYIRRKENIPPCRDWVWWDGDLLRETFTRKARTHKATQPKRPHKRTQDIAKWGGDTLTPGIEGDILMIADLYGDWREEIVTAVQGELRIYTTNLPARDRRVTLIQDPVYRSYIAHRSMGYPQSPVPSYYLGE